MRWALQLLGGSGAVFSRHSHRLAGGSGPPTSNRFNLPFNPAYPTDPNPASPSPPASPSLLLFLRPGRDTCQCECPAAQLGAAAAVLLRFYASPASCPALGTSTVPAVVNASGMPLLLTSPRCPI